jgi:hypothetical protein
MTVLCLVERDGAGVADASLRALTFARGLAGRVTRTRVARTKVAWTWGGPVTSGVDLGGADRRRGPRWRQPGQREAGGGPVRRAEALASETPAGQELAGYGVSDAYVIEPGQLPGYAPLAWARVLAGLIESDGRDRGAGRGDRPWRRGDGAPRRAGRRADGGQLRVCRSVR